MVLDIGWIGEIDHCNFDILNFIKQILIFFVSLILKLSKVTAWERAQQCNENFVDHKNNDDLTEILKSYKKFFTFNEIQILESN